MNKCVLAGTAFVIEEDALWLISSYTDMLLKVKWDTKEVVSAYQIPGGEIVDYAHTVMRKIADKIFIFPLHGRGFFCFDAQREVFELKVFKYLGEAIECKVRIAEIMPNGHLLFIDYDKNIVFELDPVTDDVKRLYQTLNDELKEKGVDVEKPLFFWQYFRKSSLLYVPLYGTHFYVCFDMESYNYTICELHADIKIQFIGGRNDEIVITTFDNQLIVTSEKGIIKRIDSLEYVIEDGGSELYPMFIGSKLYLLPFSQRKLYLYNDEIMKIELPYQDEDNDYPEGRYSQFEAIFTKGNSIYLQKRSDGGLIRVDTCDDGCEEISLSCSDSIKQAMIIQITSVREKYMFIENNVIDSKHYFAAIGN